MSALWQLYAKKGFTLSRQELFSGEDVHGIKASSQGDFSYFIADSDNCPLYKPRSPHLLRCESQHRL